MKSTVFEFGDPSMLIFVARRFYMQNRVIESELDTHHGLQNTRVAEVPRSRLVYGTESSHVERAVWIPAQSRGCECRRAGDDSVRLWIRAESQIGVVSREIRVIENVEGVKPQLQAHAFL